MDIELQTKSQLQKGNGDFTESVMRRSEKKLQSMDWDWTEFAWEERIKDTLLVGSEKKVKNVEIQVGNGGINSDEKSMKIGKRTPVIAPARSPRRVSNLNCLVDGCKADLSNCKDYHRRHRVCERHSKVPVVLVNGEERRFCQQCSRFHSLGEFDEVKRSCRKRLDGHNQRRRKPLPESIYLTPKDFMSNFKGPRILQFSSCDLDAKIALAPYVWKTEPKAKLDDRRKLIPATVDREASQNPSATHIRHVGDKQVSLKQHHILADNPPPPVTASPENSGCALYPLSSSPSEASGPGLSCFDLPHEYYYAYSRESAAIGEDTAPQTSSDGQFEAELSPSFMTASWEFV